MESTTQTIQRNTLATVSFALGLIGFLLIPFIGLVGVACAIAAIACGIIALNQIKRTGQSGRGLAIAGIVLGGLTPVWITVLFSLLGPIIQQTFLNVQQSLGQ
jgi:hypothetical protein